MKAQQKQVKSTKYENTSSKMLILRSLEALQLIQTWSHASAVSSIQELRSCVCTCVAVQLCTLVYFAIPPVQCVCSCVAVQLCSLHLQIALGLLAHIAASIQFRNGREKKTLALSKHHCSSWKVNVPCKGAIILNLKLFFNP